MSRFAQLAMLICGFGSAVAAQALIDASTAHRLQASLSAELPLNCEWSRTAPALSYRLQIQFGYLVEVPLSQFPGKGHELWALLEVTPRDAEAKAPSFFLRHYELPPILATDFSAKFNGALQAGEGTYDVAATLFDEQRRSCRAEWQVHVNPTKDERAALTGMPAHAVAGVTSANSQATNRAGNTVNRLTILVHATSADPGQSVLTGGDIRMLTDALGAILEELPARDVRVVIFSLARQEEFYRQNGFRQQDIDHVTEILGNIGPGAVDVSALVSARSFDAVAGLLNRELTDPARPDLIVFLGPPGLTNDRSHRYIFAQRTLPPIFYIECAARVRNGRSEYNYSDYGSDGPPRVVSTDGRLMNGSANPQVPRAVSRPQPGLGANSNEFNTLRHTVSALKGKTFLVWRPLDLAEALEKIVSAVHKRNH